MTVEARLARLEAAEAVRSVLARYVHLMDGGRIDELMGLFTEDAELCLENEASAGGGRVDLRGRSDISGHYSKLAFGWFRHHAATTSLDVSPDATFAELSSYFLTSYPQGVEGGLYEARLRRDTDGAWRIERWHVTSSWNWYAGPGAEDSMFFKQLGDLTVRGGLPVAWDATCSDGV